MPFLLFMPSYNQARFIVEAVQSVLAQDDPDWELWIVDNSSDNTPDAMRRFDDPRIRFHHIPERMDPGSCLNWMLARATGRDFSYVHTDNNLHPSYVRKMRAALTVDPLALAYCEMRTIDEAGCYVNVYRRGSFDLARLVSVDSLGVPFAATRELADRIGGFSARDFADDVRFCVSAYGVAHYVHIPDALLDYRLHRASRTEDAGGGNQMQQLFAKMMPKLIPVLEARGAQPVAALERAIRAGFVELDLIVEDIWWRKLARVLPAWWQGSPKFDDFFFFGWLKVKGFSRSSVRPPLRLTSKWQPWLTWIAIVHLYWRRKEMRRVMTRTQCMLVAWAAIRLHEIDSTASAIRIASLDFRTIWAARQLQMALGTTPLIDASLPAIPSWLSWARARGHEPLLDCSDAVAILRAHGHTS